MIAYKAFKDTSLTAGGKRYSMGQTARTDKPCVLRVSGLHACTSVEAAKKYYPELPVLVVCEVAESDIVDSHNGVIVAKALTPREFIANTVPRADYGDDSGDDEELSSSERAGNIADRLRGLANDIDELEF